MRHDDIIADLMGIKRELQSEFASVLSNITKDLNKEPSIQEAFKNKEFSGLIDCLQHIENCITTFKGVYNVE